METCPVSPPMPRLYARPRGRHLKLLCQNEFVDVLRLCALSEKEVPGQTIDHQESIAKRMIKYLLFARSHEIWQREIL